MTISRRDALMGAGAAAVVAGVPAAVQADDAEGTDRLATAEDYLATTFEAPFLARRSAGLPRAGCKNGILRCCGATPGRRRRSKGKR